MHGLFEDVVESHGEVELVDPWGGDGCVGQVEVVDCGALADHVVDECTQRKDVGVGSDRDVVVVEFGARKTFVDGAKVEGSAVRKDAINVIEKWLFLFVDPDMVFIDIEAEVPGLMDQVDISCEAADKFA
jgi:hypothetical protein